MSRIQLLTDSVVGQIAAGEVVERPASVVKELVENALDAGANNIRILVESAGISRIRVADDGSGMGEEDARLAFQRHATSKLVTVADLESIETLGFRGEALASIAAVGRVALTTAESAGEGMQVRVEGGSTPTYEPSARPRGTTIEVSNLFFNVPARRSFLKTPATELRWITEIVQGYALTRPDVGFQFTNDERVILDAPAATGDDPALERISRMFGRAFAERLTPFRSGWARGYIGNHETSRGKRQFTFVNGRWVRDRSIMATFYRAVRETWKTDRFPALFLYLRVPPDAVDVNVHPQKTEVRFRDSGLLREVGFGLRRALETTMGEVDAPVQGFAPDDRPGFAGSPAAPAWPASLAWEGLGGRGASGAGEIRDARGIAEAVYSPLHQRSPELTTPLSGRQTKSPSLRLVGQYKGTMILLEGPDALYLVDQHVAHERILYERLRHSLQQAIPEIQSLLQPIMLDLTAAEVARLREEMPALERCGFALRELSGDALGMVGVPTALTPAEAEALVVELATDEDDSAEELGRRLLNSFAASMACRGAVKMHDPLTPQAMEELISELFRAEHPWSCPHGRPVVLEMTDRDLESRFGRR